MKRFKINVLTLQGKVLTFHVSSYEVIEGEFIEFTDERTDQLKRFHSSRVEIEEVSDGRN